MVIHHTVAAGQTASVHPRRLAGNVLLTHERSIDACYDWQKKTVQSWSYPLERLLLKPGTMLHCCVFFLLLGIDSSYRHQSVLSLSHAARAASSSAIYWPGDCVRMGDPSHGEGAMLSTLPISTIRNWDCW